MSYAAINQAALSYHLPEQWFPLAKKHGQSLRLGNVNGELGSSLWICLRSGRWKDHATGEGGGDLISLYAAKEDISNSLAKKRLRDMLGDITSTQFSLKTSKRSKNLTGIAQKIWRNSAAIENTQAEKYLKSRGIQVLPKSLRYEERLYHSQTRQNYPAMISAITRWPNKMPHAVHRTYLQQERKANIEPNRMMLGQINGGAVRMGRFDKILALAEGIETALSVQQLTDMPTWAVLSSSNYSGLILPDSVEEVHIFADHDKAGLSKAQDAALQWKKTDLKVSIKFPKHYCQDFNDLIAGGCHG